MMKCGLRGVVCWVVALGYFQPALIAWICLGLIVLEEGQALKAEIRSYKRIDRVVGLLVVLFCPNYIALTLASGLLVVLFCPNYIALTLASGAGRCDP